MAIKNDIEIYSAHIEWKSVIAEIFIRAIRKKIYKYMTSVSKSDATIYIPAQIKQSLSM